MAEIENKIIFTTDAGDAITNVADLTKYIKEQKDALKDDTASLDDNQKAVQNLTKAQNELRQIMHTSAMTVDDAMKYRRTEGKTYNDLVKDLAELKKAYRTTADPTAQKAIANNIRDVDNRLKEMDADMGSFKRSVGNYSGGIIDAFKKMGGGASVAVTGVQSMNSSLKLLGANPVVGMLMVLVGLLQKVVSAAKSSEQATAALSAAMAPFKSIGDATTRVLQNMAEWLAKAVKGTTELLVKMKILKAESMNYAAEEELALMVAKERRSVNEDNAIHEQNIAELRAKMAEKEKYTLKERLEFAEEWKKENELIQKNNLHLAKKELELLEAQSSHTKNTAEREDELSNARVKVTQATTQYHEAMRACNKQIAEMTLSMQKADNVTKQTTDDIYELLGKGESKLNKANDGFVFKQAEVDMDKLFAEDEKALMREIAETSTETTNAIIDNAKRERQAEEDRKKAYIDSAFSAAAATSSILGSIADAMESSEDATEQQLQSVKGMRIAAATIDTISGAIGAFTTAAANPGGIPGMIIGAVNAAAITAAGIAQIAQIKNTKISKNGSSSSAPSVSVPTISTDVQATPTVTGISAEDTLNKIAANSKVILVESEVQASGAKAQAKTAETSFA